jgi:hypothetical protein
MTYTRLVTAAVCGVVLLSVSACSDLTGVGSEVGDPLDGGDPTSFELVADSLETNRISSETGFGIPAAVPTSGRNSRRTWRFLVGGVDDPLVGRIEADGYVDLDSTDAVSATMQNAGADTLEAELRFTTSYLHGDSTSALQVQLFDLVREEDMGRAPADTSFDTEAQAITTSSVSPTDSLVTLSLPSSWIAEHKDVLLNPSANLEEEFHGLKIAGTTSSEAVVGFNYGTATLRIRTASRSDSVDYQLEQAFTHIERSGRPSVSLEEGSEVLLDGVGIGLSMTWKGNQVLDSLRTSSTPLNRAEITIPVDTVQTQASLQDRPDSFVRPLPSGYRIRAIRASGSPQCGQLGLFVLSEAAQTCFIPTNSEWVPYAARASSDVAFTLFDYTLSNSLPFSSFRVEVAERATLSPSAQQTARRGLPSTIPVVVRTSAPAGDSVDLPYVTLVITPL